MSHLNGYSGLPPPSPADLILGELRSVRAEVGAIRQEVGEIRGEFRAGTRALNANDRELFEQNRDLRDRLTRIEARPAPSGPQPTARAGLLTSLASLSATVTPLLPAAGLILYIMAALGVAIDPTLISALTGRE